MTKAYILQLVYALQLPDAFSCQKRSTFSSTEGLFVLLKRIRFPCRYVNMIPRFEHPVSVLSLITSHMVDYIYETHGHLIMQWKRNLLNPVVLQTYANYISGKGSPLTNCFGFIERTVQPIVQPGHAQRTVYNGQKPVNSLKFQAIALPNGLIGNLYGLVHLGFAKLNAACMTF